MLISKILGRGSAVQRLMGTYGVVHPLPLAQGPVQRPQGQVAVVEVVKLLGVGALGPLHVAVELGGTGAAARRV